MQDEPTPIEILAAVATFLRTAVIPEATPHTRFQARVAVKALDLVIRQLDLAPAAEMAESERLAELLGQEGALLDLNRTLCERLASGEISPAFAGLLDHVWETTLAKLAVDQPLYSGYRSAIGVV